MTPPIIPNKTIPPPPPTDTNPSLPSLWQSQRQAAERAGLVSSSSRIVHKTVPVESNSKSLPSNPTSDSNTSCHPPESRGTTSESVATPAASLLTLHTPCSEKSSSDTSYSID